MKVIKMDKKENCCTGFDSEIFEEWIAHCIRKHVNGGVDPKMTREQCLAAAYDKLRKGELKKTTGDSYIVIADGETFHTVTLDAGGFKKKSEGDSDLSREGKKIDEYRDFPILEIQREGYVLYKIGKGRYARPKKYENIYFRSLERLKTAIDNFIKESSEKIMGVGSLKQSD